MASFAPTPAEISLVNSIFDKNDPQKFNIITGDIAVGVFAGAELSSTVLGEIWSLADDENNGFLTRKGVAIAVRLVGWAQNGEHVSKELIYKPGPLAVLNGYPHSKLPDAVVSSPKLSASGLPPLTTEDRAKFDRLFQGCGPVNGLLSGDKARDVFVKSKLPVDTLSQIWALSDTQSRGSLDLTDFRIAMYLIQAYISGKLPFVPTTLPPGLYDMASDRVEEADANVIGTGGSSSQVSGPHLPHTSDFVRPQAKANGPSQNPEITPSEKARFDSLFESLDTQKRSYVEGDVAVPFMLQSKLPEEELARIWDLADLNNDGRLTRDGFAVAMWLIQTRLGGHEIPGALPQALIPGALHQRVFSSPPFQGPLQDMQQDLLWDNSLHSASPLHSQAQTTQSEQAVRALQPETPDATIWPIRSAAPDPDPSSASHPDLLGDDEGTVNMSLPGFGVSVDSRQARKDLTSTNQIIQNAKAEQRSMEESITANDTQLVALQAQLDSAKTSLETEGLLLTSLKDRHARQMEDINRTRQELIRAESDLSAVRVEKAEIEHALLRDKEEVRTLHRRMTETGVVIEQLKTEIEKTRRSGQQQKGLVAIAKKQLSARDGEKARVEKKLQDIGSQISRVEDVELVEANATILTPGADSQSKPRLESSAVPVDVSVSTAHQGLSSSPDSIAFAASQPLPATPTISPSPTGGSMTSQRTNPFTMLAASRGQTTLQSQSPLTSSLPPDSISDGHAGIAPTVSAESDLDDPSHITWEPGRTGRPGEISPNSDNVTQIPSTPPLSVPGLTHIQSSSGAEFEADGAHGPLENFPIQGVIRAIPQLPIVPPGQPDPAAGSDFQWHLKRLDIDASDSSDGEPSLEANNSSKKPESLSAFSVSVTQQSPPSSFPFDDSFSISVSPQGPFPSTSSHAVPSLHLSDAIPVTPSTVHPPAISPSKGLVDFDEALGKIPDEPATALASATFDSIFEDNFDFGNFGEADGPAASNGVDEPIHFASSPLAMTLSETSNDAKRTTLGDNSGVHAPSPSVALPSSTLTPVPNGQHGHSLFHTCLLIGNPADDAQVATPRNSAALEGTDSDGPLFTTASKQVTFHSLILAQIEIVDRIKQGEQ
ncbi:hypothetical protein EWM64_g9574 [Hericium alpestre]|uniref:Uncharacterized protein n=1 Tax=Hericium alpestre TaxID=135208 RepID=A0A4Y9ZLN0_9AGAM|nr:hypothetical protein EWM64_g9574 [Hericium alpestre]